MTLSERYIQPNQRLVYPIHFENIGEIEALDVFITDTLDINLDDSSLEVLSPGASYDAVARTVSWNLFGRNLQPGESDSVLMSIRPVPGLPSGTLIQNSAEIRFEVFEILETPQVVNVIDTTPPSCVVSTLPSETTDSTIRLSWSGTDTVGEISAYSIFQSIDDGGYLPLFTETQDTSNDVAGSPGERHAFFCVAKDTVGNIEEQSLIAEATVRFIGDSDSDGVPDELDNCPNVQNPDQSDFDGDTLGDACDGDVDGDQVLNSLDVCPSTVIPEEAPQSSSGLGPNRWALFTVDGSFTQAPPQSGRVLSITTTETRGCSCEQIVSAAGLGNAHLSLGCSTSALLDWIN